MEDDAGSRKSVKKFLERIHHQVTECADGQAAVALIKRRSFDLVLSDIMMPHMSGLDLLKHIKQAGKLCPPVVLFTGCSTIDSAVKALRLGAFDYLLKPVNAEQLVTMLERVEANMVVSQAYTKPDTKAVRPGLTLEITGYGTVSILSKQMAQVFREAQMYSTDRTIPVLIRGETGTGKEVVARVIHGAGPEKDRPFVDINCAAITQSLFESELFGYEAGTFTGSLAKGKKGKFDLAAGGTLFLDEVAEIPLEMQAKLLRVLQEKEYYRVGGLQKVKTDARIICATNVNLEEAVESGKFRQDLYYRLKVGQISLPPLRERGDELILLAATFLKEFAKTKNKSFQGIAPEALQVLAQYHWPGNIRELRNVIERAVFMFDDTLLRPEHFDGMLLYDAKADQKATNIPEPAVALAYDACLDENHVMDEHIITLVEQAVEANKGNKAAAARSLGIARSSVYRILNRKKEHMNS